MLVEIKLGPIEVDITVCDTSARITNLTYSNPTPISFNFQLLSGTTGAVYSYALHAGGVDESIDEIKNVTDIDVWGRILPAVG